MVILIHGEVTSDTLKNVRAQLSTLKDGEAVQLRIDSPGGDLLSGLSIYNELKPHNPEVFIDGLAGSIASVIMLAGDCRHIVKTGTVAIHNAQQVIMMEQGDQHKFRDIADNLEMLSNVIVGVYEQSLNINRDTIKAAMDKETFMNAQEALQLGFVTDIAEPIKLVAKFDNMKLIDFLKQTQNNVVGPSEAAVLAEGTANNIAGESEEEEEAPETAAFSEAQMTILADMIQKTVSAAVSNQVNKEVNTILNKVVSTGTPNVTANTVQTEQQSAENGFTAFAKAKAQIKNIQ